MPTEEELRALLDRWERWSTRARGEYGAGEEYRNQECIDELESLLRPQEPEQAARERLAAFLLAHEGAYYEWLETSDEARPYRIVLSSVVQLLNEGEAAFNAVDMRGATPADAISAALDAAERNRT